MKKKSSAQQRAENQQSLNRLFDSSNKSADEVIQFYSTSENGFLDEEQIEKNKEEYGANIIANKATVSVAKRFFLSFMNPFTYILLILALVSFITGFILAPEGEKNLTTTIIIIVMVVFSGTLHFVQESRSSSAATKLSEMVETTTNVERNNIRQEIPLDEVVVGDIVNLAAGDIIPADVRIIRAKDFFVSQSSLTGESDSIEKTSLLLSNKKYESVTDRDNLAFMGSTVISGAARAVVIVTGDHTLFGQIASKLNEKSEKTAFDKGVNSVSWVLIKFMFVMVPIVFFVNGLTKGDWMSAFLFAISIAVGLTPEMLPMIVTSCLAKGAVSMSKKKVIVKNIGSIQNFGAIDVLCTDKTGTLTQDRVVLEDHLNVAGFSDPRVLRHAFLNSFYQTGLKNLMDRSIMARTNELSSKYAELVGIDKAFTKIDEIPFDFQRKRMTVVVKDKNEKTQMITKGAVEEILPICTYVEYQGEIRELTDEMEHKILDIVDGLSDKGFRVIAVAQKTNPSVVGAFSVKDESNMVLIGYLTFFDPPKETTKDAIASLHNYGVKVKVLTGDNSRVTLAICGQVGIPVDSILLGKDVEKMSDEELKVAVEKTNIFAKLSPDQKARVVSTLRGNGHVVGYMGDGINDAPAMKSADIGISVDTAADIARESAHIILLEKDLNVLKDGIVEGRKTYLNMIKYIKMTVSSNFGNMLSMLIAAAFLPFLPMMPIQLIFLNLFYDLACCSIPWDNVDKDLLNTPRKWDAGGLSKFMLFLGPVSSIFDLTTYAIMFFVICPLVAGYWGSVDCNIPLFVATFQTGWFIESMWSQTLVIHMIRTPKIPFIKSHASWQVCLMTMLGIAILTIVPFTPIGTMFGLVNLPLVYFGFLSLIVVVYMVFATVVKKLFIKKFGSLL